jgi:hypothetical protein
MANIPATLIIGIFLNIDLSCSDRSMADRGWTIVASLAGFKAEKIVAKIPIKLPFIIMMGEI